MAINGTFYGATGNAWIKPRIEWSAQSNLEGNYSDVTATLSYTRTNYGYTTYGHWGGSLTINGDTRYASGVYIEITANGYTAAITHTVRVYHDDDGTKRIEISAGGGISDTTLTYTTISGQVTLEAIPRASTIGATDADIGSVSMVTVGRRSDQYTHTVAYRFGELSGYLTTNGISSTAVKLTQTSISFLLPESFYQQILNASSGVCTLTCTTYRGDTVIGVAQQTTFTVRANPEKCSPILSAQAADTNSVTVALTGNSAKAVRYASNMRCSMTCQARFGAEITEKKIADKILSEDTLTITGIESGSIRFQICDSRGYTAQTTLTPELVLYFQPTGKLTVARTDATSGQATLQVQGSWFSGSFGAKKNSLQLRYRVNSGSWQSLQAAIDGDTYTASAQLTELEYTQSHKITLEVMDKIHTLRLNAQVNPGIPVFDWGKSDVQFHVPVDLGGNKVTGLGDPNDFADALPYGYACDTFAPAGYGLGQRTVNMPPIDNADNAKDTGWYRINAATTNGLGAAGIMRVEGVSDTYGTQTAIRSANGAAIRRACINGAWNEWDWLDPLMEPGIEYRTTERWNGKAVYAKLVNCGLLPNGTTKTVAHGASATQILRCVGQDITSGRSLPFLWKGQDVYLFADKTHIAITTTADFSQDTAYAQIWYTKT